MNQISQILPPFAVNVSSPRGAPMGRRDSIPADLETVKTLSLSFVPFVDGDYDAGGAYWGGGKDSLPLFCAWGESDTEQAAIYLRAAGWSSAAEQVKLTFPNATIENAGLSDFARAYIIAALWSSNDEDGTPLDDQSGLDDMDPDTLATMAKESDEFAARNRELIDTAGLDDSRAGHNFWLSRCGHGSGFFDEPASHAPLSVVNACDRLQEASRKAGERNIYRGDDQKIYQE